jgi:hypothetical protein
MNNSTGNPISLSGHPPGPAPDDRRPGSGLAAIPDLIYPQVRWNEDDYARLEARLDLYTDFVVLSKFFAGEVSEKYVVDPAEVAAALAGLELGSGLLPENCLFWSKRDGWDRLGIYLPPRSWLVTVRDETQAHSTGPSTGSGGASGQAWRIPLPGLVFTGHEYNYSLWAVTERPTEARTPLYLAPCPNVSLEGVCRGSAPFPRASTLTLWQAVDVFFSSKFNRDLSNSKSRAYPACVLDQWRALAQAGAEHYPLEDLVPTRLTLGGLIKDV